MARVFFFFFFFLLAAAAEDDWSVDEAAYRGLLAEAGAAPAAHLRDLVW